MDVDSVYTLWETEVTRRGWELLGSCENGDFLSWLIDNLGLDLAYYYHRLTCGSDDSLWYNKEIGVYFPVEIIEIEGSLIKPCFPNEDQAVFSNDFSYLQSLYDSNILSSLFLKRTTDNGFPLAVARMTSADDFRSFVLSKVKYNYKSHLFGEKSKDICVKRRPIISTWDIINVYPEFEKVYAKKWGSFYLDTFVLTEAVARIHKTSPYMQETLVCGKLGALVVYMPVGKTLVLDGIAVSDNPEFSRYSLYGISHLESIRFAYEQGYEEVRCGDFFISNKDKIGFESEPLESIDFTDSFKQLMQEEKCIV